MGISPFLFHLGLDGDEKLDSREIYFGKISLNNSDLGGSYSPNDFYFLMEVLIKKKTDRKIGG